MLRRRSMASEQLCSLCFFVVSVLFISVSGSIVSEPHAADSFNVSLIQNLGSCSYTVIITTSCSSPRYTRDQISIAFGDGYGNQIYAPRLDDPSSKTFEQCSSDTFKIDGPCAYQICYVYLYRSGPDGWFPESVKIYGRGSNAVTFTYNTHVPESIWYGFNYCNSASGSTTRATDFGRIVLVFLGSIIAGALLL